MTVHSTQPHRSTLSAKLLSLTCFPTYSITSLTLHGMLEQHEGGADILCAYFTHTRLCA